MLGAGSLHMQPSAIDRPPQFSEPLRTHLACGAMTPAKHLF
jgi:hypothetical protein